MDAVQKVKQICKERKIAISRLEKDLGFGNAYISQLKKGVFPYDRAVAISNYLGISLHMLLTGEEEQKEKTVTVESDDLDVLDLEFIQVMKQLTDIEKRGILAQMKALVEMRGQ